MYLLSAVKMVLLTFVLVSKKRRRPILLNAHVHRQEWTTVYKPFLKMKILPKESGLIQLQYFIFI